MIVVLSKGIIINYAAHFPGEPTSLHDFLPPAEGATASYIPPIYLQMVNRPARDFMFNRMCAFLIAHLVIFSPGAKLPNWAELLQDSPKIGITVCGYQYNLSGDIVPVPRQFYNDRYIAPMPFHIEDREGNLLATLQFLPWQDGGVVWLRGKLPLEGLLVFLGEKGVGHGGIIRRPEAQISYVLPITKTDFGEMLSRIQRQSNMVVRRDTTKLIVEKFLDEGTSSPFIARLFLGILRLADTVFLDHAKKEEFGNVYNSLAMAMLNTRTTAQEITQILYEHTRKLSQGEIGQIHGQVIRIEDPIDRELRRQVESFLNSAVRAIKQGMQDVTKGLHVNIGFLFKKPSTFANGVVELEKSDPHLAEYLRQSREWSERLVDSRNAVEHEGWMLPKIKYSCDSGGICAEEPQISGQQVSEFVNFMMDRLSCFVEEVTAHCLQLRMQSGISITEIPILRRQLEIPLRFQVTLKDGGMPIWVITYHESAFDES